MSVKENLIKLAEIFNVSLEKIIEKTSLENEEIENSIKDQKIILKIDRNSLTYIYVICIVFGLLAFILSMSYVEKKLIWILIGIIGMSSCGYFIVKLVNINISDKLK